MTQALPKLVTFDEFIEWYPDSSEHKYELHDGIIVEMPKPTGKHSKITGFISGKLFIEIERLQLPYYIPKECVIKPAQEAGYEPDTIILDELRVAADEPRWEKESIITLGSSIRLVIEVVSTNWEDDYARKLEDYEAIGIPEYWIVEDTALDGFPGLKQVSVDYAALGGKRFIGNPKQPTISVYSLVEGEYQVTQFRGDNRIQSPTFPELNLTAQQIFLFGN